MSNTTLSTPSLAQRIQALPQELQDMVFGYATKPSSSNTVVLTKSYLPPPALQVNHKTREKFAAEYYPATTIRVDFHRLEDNDNVRMLARFMDSLPATHLDMVQAIEVDERIPIAKRSISYTAWTANSKRVALWDFLLTCCKCDIDFNKFRVSYKDVCDQGRIKWTE